MRRHSWRIPLLLSSLALTSAEPRLAWAEGADGEQLFKEGLELLEAAERTHDAALFDRACDRFARSFAAEELLNPLIHLARCEEGRGHLHVALKTWRAAANLAKTQSDPSGQVRAETAATLLEGKLPRIVVRLSGSARGASVDIDGESVAPDEPVFVDRGPHKVRAKQGAEVEAKDVTVERGLTEVALVFEARPAPSSTPPDSGVDLSIPGWVVVAVAGAAWVGTGVTSALYVTRCDEPFTCPENTFGDGLAEANLALWVAAPVLTGVGVALLIVEATDDDGEPAAVPPSTVGAGIWSTGGGAGVRVFGSF